MLASSTNDRNPQTDQPRSASPHALPSSSLYRQRQHVPMTLMSCVVPAYMQESPSRHEHGRRGAAITPLAATTAPRSMTCSSCALLCPTCAPYLQPAPPAAGTCQRSPCSPVSTCLCPCGRASAPYSPLCESGKEGTMCRGSTNKPQT